jgi:hypothetical protein
MQATTFNIDDLNNQLFAQLQLLNTELQPEELKAEVTKAKSMADLAGTILEGKRIQLEAIQLISGGNVYPEQLKTIIAPKNTSHD